MAEADLVSHKLLNFLVTKLSYESGFHPFFVMDAMVILSAVWSKLSRSRLTELNLTTIELPMIDGYIPSVQTQNIVC